MKITKRRCSMGAFDRHYFHVAQILPQKSLLQSADRIEQWVSKPDDGIDFYRFQSISNGIWFSLKLSNAYCLHTVKEKSIIAAPFQCCVCCFPIKFRSIVSSIQQHNEHYHSIDAHSISGEMKLAFG